MARRGRPGVCFSLTLRVGGAEFGRGVCVVMKKSWIRASVLAGFCALGYLLFRGLAAEGAPHAGAVALAGGLYTVAFALRVS